MQETARVKRGRMGVGFRGRNRRLRQDRTKRQRFVQLCIAARKRAHTGTMASTTPTRYVVTTRPPTATATAATQHKTSTHRISRERRDKECGQGTADLGNRAFSRHSDNATLLRSRAMPCAHAIPKSYRRPYGGWEKQALEKQGMQTLGVGGGICNNGYLRGGGTSSTICSGKIRYI